MGREQDGGEPLEQAAEMAARLARAAGQAEKVVHSVQIAKAVEAAAKAGGAAVSGTAAGAALAGPLGAAVGAILTSRTFWKAVLSVLLALLLFVFILVNSVELILTQLGFSSADSYVTQAREAEYQSVKKHLDTMFAEYPDFLEEIERILEGYRDEVFEEIEDDFDDNWDGYDGYEVSDEYETVLKPALSQYLAVLIEEKWSGSQILGLSGYGGIGGITGNLNSPYDEYFALAAATYQVPEALLKAMAKQESGFDPNAVSSAGAIGIMQLMPATAAGLGVENPYDPKQNIMGGAKYVAQLYRTFGSYPNALELVIAAYNAGPGAVIKAGYRIPQNGETPAHVQKVLANLSLSGTGETGENSELTGVEDSGTGIWDLMIKELVTSEGNTFFGWAVTGTHTETIDTEDEEEGEEEIEIVDYALVVKLNASLPELEAGYSYRYVTDPGTFQSVLTLFQVMESGTDGALDRLFQQTSWKNYVIGAGATEDIFSSVIETGGDTITYETVENCIREVVYFNQGEEPWASGSYGGGTISAKGCGPTALAIVVSTLTGNTVTPQTMADYAMVRGDYVSGKGTSHEFPTHAARHWGLSVERVKREQVNYVMERLKDGALAVVICAENTISGSSGHYIVLTGVTEDGYITIADPGSRSRTGNLYSPQTIQSYARNLAAGGIWIIGTGE